MAHLGQRRFYCCSMTLVKELFELLLMQDTFNAFYRGVTFSSPLTCEKTGSCPKPNQVNPLLSALPVMRISAQICCFKIRSFCRQIGCIRTQSTSESISQSRHVWVKSTRFVLNLVFGWGSCRHFSVDTTITFTPWRCARILKFHAK
jgi:hypothetical protein